MVSPREEDRDSPMNSDQNDDDDGEGWDDWDDAEEDHQANAL